MQAVSHEYYDLLKKKIADEHSVLQEITLLHKSLCPSKKLRVDKLNENQIFAQIYQHTKNNVEKLKGSILEEIGGEEVMNEEEHPDDEGNLDEEQDGLMEEEGNEDGEDIEDDEQLEGDEYEEEEGDEYEQEEMNEEALQQGENADQEERGEFQNSEYDEEISENDVGLYGEQLDQEDMQSYENEEMDDDPQFQRQLRNANKSKNKEQEDFGEEDDDAEQQAIEDNFDYFRELQMKNQENQETLQEGKNNGNKSALEQQIEKLEDKVMGKKEWALMGQVKAKDRPVNSLLEQDLQFRTGIKFTHQIDEKYNEDLQSVIRQRILDELYDDRVRYTSTMALRENFAKNPISTEKSNKGLAELYELEFKNYLGLGDNKNDRLKKQIMNEFKEINYYLDSLSNLNFTPKANPSSKFNAQGQQISVVVEEKVPITMFQGDTGYNGEKLKRSEFESDKETDRKAKRTKNKRIARQRKKEQTKNRLNRKIEYGGQTKYQVAATKKITKNAAAFSKQDKSGQKFNKSNQFFKNMTQKSLKHGNKPMKPNPNLSKMKI